MKADKTYLKSIDKSDMIFIDIRDNITRRARGESFNQIYWSVYLQCHRYVLDEVYRLGWVGKP